MVSEKIYSWFGKVMFGCVWFEFESLVWFCMVWFGLRQHPSEASVKVSSRSDLVWRYQRRFRVGLVRLCLVVYGLRKHPSETSVKFSSRSDLFWLIHKVRFVLVWYGMVWFGLV